jgi:predicted cupin superfamily sugar epimerase
VRVHQTLKVSPAMAAGVTDSLWEISDLVQVLEDWEAQQHSEPSFIVDTHAIDGKPFARVTFPNGETGAIYNFKTREEAIKWIRCEDVVWLYEKRQKKAIYLRKEM